VFGIAAMNVLGVMGGVFYFLSHILGKAILFSSAGILVYTVETRDLRRMSGLWHRMPVTAVLWFSAALILSALPPTSGFVGKWLFFSGAFQKVQAHPLGLVIVVMAIMASLMTLVYTFMVGIRIFFGRPNPDLDTATDPPLTMSIPLVCLALLALFLGLFPQPVLTLIRSVVGTL
jgi:NADH-quinone oxidoreductase subunit M